MLLKQKMNLLHLISESATQEVKYFKRWVGQFGQKCTSMPNSYAGSLFKFISL